jgi:HEPN domain-containing protein
MAEHELWWKQSAYELEVAKTLLEANLFSAASFHAHQAVEMALKALCQKEFGSIQTHDLTFMAKKLKAPGKMAKHCADLNPVYTETRYVDTKGSLPSEEYTVDDSQADIEKAEEVIEWIE